MNPPPIFNTGDIIEIDRILYKHYAIYTGGGKVIHYSAENSDFGIEVKVREISLEQFTKDDNCKLIKCIRNRSNVKVFSPEETVNRARSRLGEKSYNLVFNNCEHFALWCKYGENKSVQVEKALGVVVLLGSAVIVSQIIKNIDNEE